MQALRVTIAAWLLASAAWGLGSGSSGPPSPGVSAEEADEAERDRAARRSERGPNDGGITAEEQADRERARRAGRSDRDEGGGGVSAEEQADKERARRSSQGQGEPEAETRGDPAPSKGVQGSRPKPTPFSSTGRKIVPPARGMYLGQTRINKGDLGVFESAIGRNVAIVADPSVVDGQEKPGNPLTFDTAKAQAYWDEGYVVMIGAYEAYPGHKPFTVDKLLRGDYDAGLADMARQLKSFGKPMFFMTAREPNGVLADFAGGGFGKDGDRSLKWALDNGRGFDDFRPPSGPPGKPDLYAGLGRSDLPDAIERLAAAQRYYHDFFVRREGIDFLTFETMGWLVDSQRKSRHPRGSHGDRLESACSFENLLKCLGDCVDWISINWYLITESEEEMGVPRSQFVAYHLKDLELFLQMLDRVMPNKPVMITELGFVGVDQAEKARRGFDALVKHPRIRAAVFWGSPAGDNVDALMRPGTPSGSAIRQAVTSDPDAFPVHVSFQP